MKRLAMIFLLLPLAMAGCKREVSLVPAERIYTVEDYLTQPELRRKVSAVCSNDPGRTGQDPNCINAQRADRVASAGSSSGMPPIAP